MEAQTSLSKQEQKHIDQKRAIATRTIQSPRLHNALEKINDRFDRNRARAHFLSGILSIEEIEKGELF